MKLFSKEQTNFTELTDSCIDIENFEKADVRVIFKVKIEEKEVEKEDEKVIEERVNRIIAVF